MPPAATSASASPATGLEAVRRLRQGAFLAAGVAVVVLLGVWPYQHWDFEQRASLVGGIVKKALQPGSEWFFCLLVPPLVGWLVWRMRRALSRLPLQGTWAGAPVLVLGMAFYWFGYKVDTAYPGYLAGQLITLGLILLLGGVRWFKQLLFPWLFLGFMWPMLPLENSVSVPLRMITARMSAAVLNLIGVDVVREGTGLHSAADAARGLQQGDIFRLDVENPCSGIRSLSALVMISALYSWLSLKAWGSRLWLIASAVPLAMLGNLVRMLLLALGSVWFGVTFAVGRNIDGQQEMSTYHFMAGIAVFVVALAGMFGLTRLLERRELVKRKVKGQGGQEGQGRGQEAASVSSPSSTWRHVAAALLITGAGLTVCAITDAGYKVDAPGVKMELPPLLDGYVGILKDMTPKERSALLDDVRISRRFYTKPERGIWATVVLSGAEKRSLHPPDVCVPAQGWTIDDQSIVPVDLGDGREMQVSLMSIHFDSEPQPGRRVRNRGVNLFWYQGSDGTTCATYQEHVIRTYLDGVFRDVNHRWALMSLYVPLKEQALGFEDPFVELAAVEETKAFIRALLPAVVVGR